MSPFEQIVVSRARLRTKLLPDAIILNHFISNKLVREKNYTNFIFLMLKLAIEYYSTAPQFQHIFNIFSRYLSVFFVSIFSLRRVLVLVASFVFLFEIIPPLVRSQDN